MRLPFGLLGSLHGGHSAPATNGLGANNYTPDNGRRALQKTGYMAGGRGRTGFERRKKCTEREELRGTVPKKFVDSNAHRLDAQTRIAGNRRCGFDGFCPRPTSPSLLVLLVPVYVLFIDSSVPQKTAAADDH